MKLLTHNMLSSKGIKGVKVGFPLAVEAVDIKWLHVEFNREFVARIIPKLDWPQFYNAAKQLDIHQELPSELEENFDTNEDFLKKAHHILLEVDVITGVLTCPETGRKFPITEGVPNMLLNEDEV